MAPAARRLGITVWVKHENHTPAGAFKVRGGLAAQQGLRMVPSFDHGLIKGVMTYWLEFFESFGRGRSVGVALTGGNIDSAVFARVLSPS